MRQKKESQHEKRQHAPHPFGSRDRRTPSLRRLGTRREVRVILSAHIFLALTDELWLAADRAAIASVERWYDAERTLREAYRIGRDRGLSEVQIDTLVSYLKRA